MGKSTISMAIFNSYVSLPEGILLGFATSSFAIWRFGNLCLIWVLRRSLYPVKSGILLMA